jgi:DNA-binding MarR family transcriptional regulator
MKSATSSKAVAPSALHLLHRAGQCADDLFARNIGKVDLTPRQFAVLRCVADNEDLSQTDLVNMTGIDRSTLADIVRRLVERGMLQRKRTKEDARMYAVRLSASGRTALANAQPAAKTTDTRLLQVLPTEQRQDFIKALSTIVESLQAAEEKEAAEPAPKKAAKSVKAAAKAVKSANGGRGRAKK